MTITLNGERVELPAPVTVAELLTDRATVMGLSDAGAQEITLLHKKVVQNLELAISAFAANDQALAQQVLERKLELGQTERRFRQAHIERLHAGYRESIDTSEIHLDVLTNLKRINSHVTAVAYPILEGA